MFMFTYGYGYGIAMIPRNFAWTYFSWMTKMWP